MKRLTAILLFVILAAGLLPALSIQTGAAFEGEDKVTIVIDPGHGGANIGTAARGVGEKVYAMKLASLIFNKLAANGSFNVYMTRTGDYDLELYERCEIANGYNADLVLSIHFDGNPVKSMNGVTAFTSVIDEYSAVPLAQSITNKLSAATGLKNNGVKRRADDEGHYWNSEKQWDIKDPSLGVLSDYYSIPTWSANFGMRSIIVEHGFFSNEKDVDIIFAEGALEKMAEAEASAIIEYYTNHTHNYYTIPTRDYPSSCVYTGKQSIHCITCGHRKSVQSLAPAPDCHYWVTTQHTPAACGVDGKTVRECRITEKLVKKGWQGAHHKETVTIPAPSDHTFELTRTLEATHTVDGYMEYKCKTCAYSFRDILKAEGHTYEFVDYTAPTCEKSGGNTYKCTGCTSSYTDEEKALGHSLGSLTVTEPTCTEDGSKRGKCTVCSADVEEAIPKLGHSVEIKENIAATCTEGGKLVSLCRTCGYEETAEQEPLGHKFEEISLTEPTCEGEGKRVLRCAACTYTKEEALKPLGHKKSEKFKVVKKSTAFSQGEVSYTCENGCKEPLIEKTPPTLSKATVLLTVAAAAFILASLAFVIIFITIRKRKTNAAKAPEPNETEAVVKETINQ